MWDTRGGGEEVGRAEFAGWVWRSFIDERQGGQTTRTGLSGTGT